MDACKTFSAFRLTEQESLPLQTAVVIEKELPIYLNGEYLATASMTPPMERELVVGYLFSQGFITESGEVRLLDITEKGAMVTVAGMRAMSDRGARTNYRIVSGGGRTAYFQTTPPRRVHSNLRVAGKDIFSAMNLLLQGNPVYKETGGVHSAALFGSDITPLCMVEDIGRHNTLDKIIGYGLLKGIDFSRTFLVSTGRMASEMVAKICRAGIPLVATKTAVTDLGMETGRKCGITIIGFVRDKGSTMHTNMDVRVFEKGEMRIYTGGERVL